MRIDSCRKCGAELREYDEVERCQICEKHYTQFRCKNCGIVTEPQYHAHSPSILMQNKVIR
ncbi:MAG: hypothetical protein WAO91_03795 [Candidatus Nitrosotenuis sp.]